MHRYTKEQIQFIRKIAKGKYVEEIRQLFIKKYKVDVTFKSITNVMYRNKIKNHMKGFNTRFEKGQTSWNKGMKGLQIGGIETQFQPGNLPPTYKPVGSESMHGGYVWVKVAEPNKWVKKQHLIWREANGPIPEGMVLRFADGNKMNVTLDNLFLTSRRVCISVVKRGIGSDDPGLNKAVHNLAELELAIKDIEKQRT